jgi:hypothetical protein
MPVVAVSSKATRPVVARLLRVKAVVIVMGVPVLRSGEWWSPNRL